MSETWALVRTRGLSTGGVATLDCISCLLVSSRALACSDSSFVVSDTYKCVNVKHSLVIFRYLLMEYVLLKHLNFKQEAQRVEALNLPAIY